MVNTVVVGLGRSGIGAARLLKTSGKSVIVIDSGNGEALERKAADLKKQGIAVQINTPLLPEREPSGLAEQPGKGGDQPRHRLGPPHPATSA